ncbi:MAG: methionyl-tRNA formyltransferase [Clostridia bacterium]|nr:methionyl-tRNA formyltransferase [Clostridia bacterium]
MKLIFLGTPDFAVPVLRAINNSKHEILAVVTQPDRPVGRKAIITPCAVKSEALNLGLKVLSYEKIRLEGVEDLRALNPDIMVTCAFGQILSQEILDIAKRGVINVHASLLPKYRGSAPIQYSVINGDSETGVTIMQTGLEVDSGDILLQSSLKIGEDETAGELFDRLSILGADMIVDALDKIERGEITPIKQDHSKATHVKMLRKEDGVIDFSKPAIEIKNLIRGLNPWPIAFTRYEDKTLKIFKAKVVDGSGVAGEVISSDKTIIVATGDKALEIEELQLEGSKRMSAKEFLLGRKIPVGYRF